MPGTWRRKPKLRTSAFGRHLPSELGAFGGRDFPRIPDLPQPSARPVLAGKRRGQADSKRKFPWNLFLGFLARLGHRLEREARPETLAAMASALSPPRVPKPKATQPSHYHESFLEKKGPLDKDYRKFWAGLQGLTIYFYNSNRDFQPLEKLDLRTFVKLTDEAPRGSMWDPGIHFSLVLRDQDIKFKAESLESREMWKGFILTVVELCVPSNLTLLPGHLYMMSEVLSKEGARRALEVPPCFLKVSRLEAQLLLERYPECGNLLLRPSGAGADNVSVSTRQVVNGTAEVRHYKVKREGSLYVIDMEEPVPHPPRMAPSRYRLCPTRISPRFLPCPRHRAKMRTT
ncbi:signal-transducing adaptor protein 2 isoform X2 [Fukomys damarensis]|uniref:signal-transducing adaptor protein 2 isoform X2 n=1 Tax=Fukomys damarensis TaxID=885580 RepID=UPI0014557576|nr:signal-transducing adaptor protein 2 isoform X2 [Fukomys damarensis]